MKQPLELFLELIGLLLAQVVEPGLVALQFGDAHRKLEVLGIDLIELQLEENEIRRDGGDLVLDVAVKLDGLGGGGVARVQQARIGNKLAYRVAQALVRDEGIRPAYAISSRIN